MRKEPKKMYERERIEKRRKDPNSFILLMRARVGGLRSFFFMNAFTVFMQSFTFCSS